MAGHRIGKKTYFVPRTLLPLAHSVEWYCRKLLPDLDRWRRQSRSAQGDKSDCCKIFLNEILPYFVEVIAQDGIYLVDEFPNHPMSNMLKVSFYYGVHCLSNGVLCLSNIFYLQLFCVNFAQNKIDGYERWAATSRAWVEQKRNSRSADQVSALDAGAKAAFETLSRRYDSLERKLVEKERVHNDKITSLQRTVDTLKTDIATVIQLLQQQQGNNAPAAPAVAAAAPAAVPQPQQQPPQEGEYFGRFHFYYFC